MGVGAGWGEATLGLDVTSQSLNPKTQNVATRARLGAPRVRSAVRLKASKGRKGLGQALT